MRETIIYIYGLNSNKITSIIGLQKERSSYLILSFFNISKHSLIILLSFINICHIKKTFFIPFHFVLLIVIFSNTKIMENNIFDPNKHFVFSNISLGQPTTIQGGAYFTKILYKDKPLFIETPKSLSKQGFVKNGKKMFCDLMFDNTNEEFINWVENLETKCQELIHEKGEDWFQNKLELNDIETAFTTSLRIYKSGKYYLMRVNVKMNYNTNIPLVKIYNESEVPLNIDDIKNDTNIISIVEIQGIKFTSRNFQIEMEMKQAMVLNTYEMFESCLIKRNTPNKHIENTKINSLEKNNISYNCDNSDNSDNCDNSNNSDNSDSNLNAGLTETTNTNISISKNEFLVTKEEPKHPTEPSELTELKEPNAPNDLIKNIKNDYLEEFIPEFENEIETEKERPVENVDFHNNDIEQQNDNKKEVVNLLANQNEIHLEDNTEKENKNLDTTNIHLNTKEYDFSSLNNNNDNYNELKEISDINFDNVNTLESIKLKKPNEFYYEIYQKAKEKAKRAKKEMLIAYLEAKNIKKTYMLDDLEDDSDNSSDFSINSDLENETTENFINDN